MAKAKNRLDLSLVDRKLVKTRTRAKAIIMAGRVFVNNNMVDKPGTQVCPDDSIIVKGDDIPFVSRGGLKLEAAINKFKLNVKGFTCLDVGASTGGFTDCLLQRGAKKVFAVDVGYGQLAWKLRKDPRVVPIERKNIRHLSEDSLPVKVDLITIDTSFISLKIVVPAAIRFMKKKGIILALIKPQFEVGKGMVGKGGVVKNPGAHKSVINSLTAFFKDMGLISKGIVPSPILGPKGNKEFVIYLKYA